MRIVIIFLVLIILIGVKHFVSFEIAVLFGIALIITDRIFEQIQ